MNEKQKINAPCSFMVWSETQQRDIKVYPAVDCDLKCDKCGWNPEVAGRRLAKWWFLKRRESSANS
jgi:hypothetical protein